MKIVIDIPDEIYKASHVIDAKYEDVIQIPLDVIAKGTPLPEHHGRLIDEQHIIDRFKPVEKFEYWRIGLDGLINVLSDASTIIEADKEVNADEDSNIR